jgi:hypothetical protein
MAHGQGSGATQQRRKLTRVGGVEVLNNDERKAGRGRKRAQQAAAGLEASGGRADAHYRRLTHWPSRRRTSLTDLAAPIPRGRRGD